uniref:Large ribosomal subunit protein uL15/eL18 domain-containing protein n=1 Tax=Fundulus heteroclitus TaxID=8078 RepID=A0A3Q2U773_FUNHE
MGVDIRHNKDRKVHRKEPKSEDIYLRLLVKLYRFLEQHIIRNAHQPCASSVITYSPNLAENSRGLVTDS